MSQSCPCRDGQYSLTSNRYLTVFGNIWIFDLTSGSTTASPYPCGKVFVLLWLRGPVFACEA